MTVDKSNQRVQEMFGEIAGRYDFLNRLLSMGVDQYWRWRTSKRVKPTGTAPILDLCAGTGDLAFSFAKRAGNSTPVVAADFCHEMLVIGEAKREKRKLAQVQFVQADAQHLPFPDDMFQVVSVAFGLRNVADTDQGLREMTRVCRPGGHVAVLEFSHPRWQPFKSVYGWYFSRVLPRVGQLLSRNRSEAYVYLPKSVGEFPEGEALAEKMRAAGLCDMEIRPLTFGIATLYVGVKR